MPSDDRDQPERRRRSRRRRRARAGSRSRAVSRRTAICSSRPSAPRNGGPSAQATGTVRHPPRGPATRRCRARRSCSRHAPSGASAATASCRARPRRPRAGTAASRPAAASPSPSPPVQATETATRGRRDRGRPRTDGPSTTTPAGGSAGGRRSQSRSIRATPRSLTSRSASCQAIRSSHAARAARRARQRRPTGRLRPASSGASGPRLNARIASASAGRKVASRKRDRSRERRACGSSSAV